MNAPRRRATGSLLLSLLALGSASGTEEQPKPPQIQDMQRQIEQLQEQVRRLEVPKAERNAPQNSQARPASTYIPMQIRFIPLENLNLRTDADQVRAFLAPLGIAYSLDFKQNRILIRATRDEMRGLIKVIQEFDVQPLPRRTVSITVEAYGLSSEHGGDKGWKAIAARVKKQDLSLDLSQVQGLQKLSTLTLRGPEQSLLEGELNAGWSSVLSARGTVTGNGRRTLGAFRYALSHGNKDRPVVRLNFETLELNPRQPVLIGYEAYGVMGPGIGTILLVVNCEIEE